MKTEHLGQEASHQGFRGRTTTIQAFARKYRLDAEEAQRLEDQFGPVAGEIELLQAARRNGMPEE
ncbi:MULTISPECIES: hypothetical protein [unclassified Ensifer]|uniref:hypothetical protein n=1 Tax=unclassified Ensifer TaxID=2633371 RepID=UPI0008133CB9|nr:MULTISPECIES: hypothetical protein [unclassified Ensifer]OCP07190.1 hypothetical protein BBX50_22765 [Ensifer sp. LC11]OCP07775.1 hypothetical protein BC374_22980 [Ensifer sp. LC13]OCP12063.1 hypothetical protein BC362_06300 [Ensifer sp. LC14]OCP31773.1 hypothetical protein BC364_21720 [Ensifer sp. LC499]